MEKQNLESLSAEELESLSYQVGAEKEAIRDYLKEIQAALSKRLAERSALAKIGSLSDSEKEALGVTVEVNRLSFGVKNNGV